MTAVWISGASVFWYTRCFAARLHSTISAARKQCRKSWAYIYHNSVQNREFPTAPIPKSHPIHLNGSAEGPNLPGGNIRAPEFRFPERSQEMNSGTVILINCWLSVSYHTNQSSPDGSKSTTSQHHAPFYAVTGRNPQKYQCCRQTSQNKKYRVEFSDEGWFALKDERTGYGCQCDEQDDEIADKFSQRIPVNSTSASIFHSRLYSIGLQTDLTARDLIIAGPVGVSYPGQQALSVDMTVTLAWLDEIGQQIFHEADAAFSIVRDDSWAFSDIHYGIHVSHRLFIHKSLSSK